MNKIIKVDFLPKPNGDDEDTAAYFDLDNDDDDLGTDEEGDDVS